MPKPNIAENKHASDIFHLGDSHQLPKPELKFQEIYNYRFFQFKILCLTKLYSD